MHLRCKSNEKNNETIYRRLLFPADLCFSCVRIMIRTIGGEIFWGFDLMQVVQEIGGGHAGELLELPIEMAVIGEAKMLDQTFEGGGWLTDQQVGHLMKAIDAHELLGGESHVLHKDPAKLAFAEASHVSQCLDPEDRLLADGQEYLGQGFVIG